MTRRTTDPAVTLAALHAAPTRRTFCHGAAALVLTPSGLLSAYTLAQSALPVVAATPTRPDVAALDRDRILAAAQRALDHPPTPITAVACERSVGSIHDYYSEAEADPSADSPAQPSVAPFTGHRDALFALGLDVPALTAAHLLTGDEHYAAHAVLHLRAWFVEADTRMTPSLNYGQVVSRPAGTVAHAKAGGRFQGILETLPLIEIAQAIPFLAASPALTKRDLDGLHAWFDAYLQWLTAPEDSGPRLPALARDQKDHHGTSWLLQSAAYANLAVLPGDVARSEDSTLASLRHHFHTVTLRAQISPEGMFKHELSSATPYRDSLFNLDMMAAVCVLLSTRFESVWDYQLDDGPGMRAAIAYHFPYLVDRDHWPFRADAQHFTELPGRRASLLFAARAYQRPEYAALWKTLPPDPASPDVLRTLPIHQPLLWVRQPPRPASAD